MTTTGRLRLMLGTTQVLETKARGSAKLSGEGFRVFCTLSSCWREREREREREKERDVQEIEREEDLTQ